MGHRSDPTLRVLHVLRLRGFADVAMVADRTGMATAEIDQCLAAAADAGLARCREGRVRGWALTSEGRSHHAELLAAEREASASHAVMAAASSGLAALDTRFRELCTDWQLRTLDASQVPNDHGDAAYDRFVISCLVALDGDAQPICLGLGQALERMAGYSSRLGRALARVQAGDADGFTRPLSDSYRDVWMELNDDLAATVGLVRTAADA
jgi:hypothetical protein